MAYYYNWTNEYIESLDIDTFIAYYNASFVIQNQNKQDMIDASMAPRMKDTKLKEMLKTVENNIKGAFKRKISPENMAYLAEQKAKEILKDG